MPLWSLFLLQVALPPNPPAVVAMANPTDSSTEVTPPPCPTPPDYDYSDWELTWDERRSEGQWVTQRLHYSRTKTDECRGTSSRQSKVEGPYRLWPAVPANRVADVNRPEGSTDSLSGSPLRSSSFPDYGAPGSIGPNPDLPTSKTPGVPATEVPAPAPFFPGFILFAGVLVATLIFRRRTSKQDPVPSRVEELVQGPPVEPVTARTMNSIKPNTEWVPDPAEVAWLQAFFGLVEPNYGPRTKAAVAEFQRKHGITPDPNVMVGPNTYRALWKEHIDLVHEQWQGVAEGRRPLVLERVFDSPLPPDLREEMAKLNEAYAAHWAAVEGRYQAILRRDPTLVAAYDEQIAAFKTSGVKVEDIEPLKAKYQPLIDALYKQAEKVKNDPDDGEYAKLLAMLDAADHGRWDGTGEVKATLDGRWAALWRADSTERALGQSVANALHPYTSLGQSRAGTASLGTVQSAVSSVDNAVSVKPTAPSWTMKLPVPAAQITTIYGVEDSLHGSGHDGVDFIPMKGDTTIMAAQSGTVVYAGLDPSSKNGAKKGYGNVVIIDHGNGYMTMYAHLDKIEVEQNAAVEVGAELGTMGSTGKSTGTHLHFGLLKGTLDTDSDQPWSGVERVNPWLYLQTEGWGTNFRRIIEDKDFRDTSAITLDQVRKVLGQSPLFKEYASGEKLFPIHAQKPNGTIFDTGRSIDVAKVVYEEATKHNLNPMLILARMQTEGALLTFKGLTPDHEWVVKGIGYAVPDSGSTDYSKTGLDFQIQNAARRLDELFNQAPQELDSGPVLVEGLNWGQITLPDKTVIKRTQTATIKQGDKVTVVSEHVGVENRATWALYTYTPHVIDLNHVLRDSRNNLTVRDTKKETPDLYTYNNPDVNNIGGGNLLFKESWDLVKSRM